jgi:RNA polymerase sigma factor (TIGR02999 family)
MASTAEHARHATHGCRPFRRIRASRVSRAPAEPPAFAFPVVRGGTSTIDRLGSKPMGDSDRVTQLLHEWRDGDNAALDRLLPTVYADLRRIAASALRSTPGHATLQTTALAHEVLLRLLGRAPSDFDNTAHFLNASARMMRQILIDRARRAGADKRGGRWLRDDFAEALELPIPDGTDLAALDRALDELEAVHARMAQVVELRYFVGLDVAEVAATLGVTERTARRDWAAAREWLRERLDAPA